MMERDQQVSSGSDARSLKKDESIRASDASQTGGYFGSAQSPLNLVAFVIGTLLIMRLVIVALPLAGNAISTYITGPIDSRVPQSLNSWLDFESPVALQGVLNNIGSLGSRVPGAKGGIVVASPSTSDPDYFYTWTRDAALTFKALIDEFIAGNADVEALIQDYITSQAYLQTVNNPSGGLCSGGLGEPKYNVDQTAFIGSWGRPQHDGPALRATAMIAYAKYLISKGDATSVSDIIWPIVQNDLSYVTLYWNSTGFDLWEEVESASFFTSAVQYRALIEGSALAKQIGQNCPNCDSEAPLVLCFLQSFWQGSHVLSNTGGGRTGKDANSILASVHLFDPAAKCDATTFQPCSDKALANHKAVTDSFRTIYLVNDGIAQGVGISVGRYAEDVYQGGNPWYLCTFSAAELLYDAVYQWEVQGSLTVTMTSLGFFKDIYVSAATGTYSSSSATFSAIVNATLAYADSYMSVAAKYTPTDGSLAEQYTRSDGTPTSAKDLTWSYAAFVTAYNARAKIKPASWGASSAQLPDSCSLGSASGPCATATITVWPGRSTTTSPCTTPRLTKVTFNALRETHYGDTVYIAGGIPQLGSWDTSQSVALRADVYTGRNPVWQLTVSVPTSEPFEYKYFTKTSTGSIVWESGSNREYTDSGSCFGIARKDDTWR